MNENVQSPQSPEEERLDRSLTNHHGALAAYVFVLVGDRSAAEDVLQETCLYIMKNWRPEIKDADFLPWAKTMALFQVRRYRLYRARESKHVLFDEEAFEKVSADLAEEPKAENVNIVALEFCLKKLPEAERACFLQHYMDRVRLAELGKRLGISPDAARMRLGRIREALYSCIVKSVCAIRDGRDLPL